MKKKRQQPPQPKAKPKAKPRVSIEAARLLRLARVREEIDHEAKTSIERAEARRAVVARATVANAMLRRLRTPGAWIKVRILRGGEEGELEYYRNGDVAGPLRARLIEAFEQELSVALGELGVAD